MYHIQFENHCIHPCYSFVFIYKTEVWGPASVLGCMLYRRHGGEDGKQLESCLDMVTRLLAKAVSHCDCSLMREVRSDICLNIICLCFLILIYQIAFDVAGLILLREALSYALSVRRKASLVVGELLSPRRYPNAVTSSPKKFFTVIQKNILTSAVNLLKKLPLFSMVVDAQIASEVDKMEGEFMATLRPADRDSRACMPEIGIPAEEILAMMNKVGKAEDKNVRNIHTLCNLYNCQPLDPRNFF